MTTVHMDSQQLWSNAQCRPGWLPAVGRRGSRELPPVTYELLTAYDFRARESGKSVFFKALPLVGWPWTIPHPRAFRQHKWNSVGYKNK